MNKDDITSLFDEWNHALQTGDPKKVVVLYESNGILLPTVSNKVRYNHTEIENYFADILCRGPKCKIDESKIRTYGEIAIHSGVYTFSFNDNSTIPARFTFVYRWNGTRWMIIEHHSSQMPETCF